jgi:hypothetical protein
MKTKPLTVVKLKQVLFWSMMKRYLESCRVINEEAKEGLTKGDKIEITYKATLKIE